MTQGIGRQLPEDYLDYLRSFDGSEGWIGDNYVRLNSCEGMSKRALVFEEFVPGVAFFGSDGAEALFGFDTRDRTMPVVITTRDNLEGSLVTMSPTFTSFMQFLEKNDWVEEWSRKYRSRNAKDDGTAA
jgi:hypothetical protein